MQSLVGFRFLDVQAAGVQLTILQIRKAALQAIAVFFLIFKAEGHDGIGEGDSFPLHLSVAPRHVVKQIYILRPASEVNGRLSIGTECFIRLIAPSFQALGQMLVGKRKKHKIHTLLNLLTRLIRHLCLQLISPRGQGINFFRHEGLIRLCLSLQHLLLLDEDPIADFLFHRHIHQIGHLEGQLLRLFLNERFSLPAGDEEPQRRASQRQVQNTRLGLPCHIGHIGRDFVGIEPRAILFRHGQEMHRYLETAFGIGHRFPRHAVGFHTSHPPEAVLQSGNPIADFRPLYRRTGETSGYPCHTNGIARLIILLHGIEGHFKSRPLVFLHAEGRASPLRPQQIDTRLSRTWQSECSLKSAESIRLHFLACHLLTVGILQYNGI